MQQATSTKIKNTNLLIVEGNVTGDAYALEPIEKALLGSIILNNELYFDFSIKAYMFRNYRNVADMVFAQLDEIGKVDIPQLLSDVVKGGVCRTEDIHSIIANANEASAKSYFEQIKNDWVREKEIEIHRISLSKLIAGEGIENVLHASEKDRDEINEVTDTSEITRTGKMNAYVDNLQAKKNGEVTPFARTGFGHRFDRILGGVCVGGRMVEWGGRPGMGKTTCAFMCGISAAEQGYPVLMNSGEMTHDQLVNIYVSNKTNIPVDRIIQGKVTDLELELIRDTVSQFYALPFYIDDYFDISNWQVQKNRTRQHKKKYDIQMVISDYAQLLKDKSQKHQSRDLELGEITGDQMKLVKQLGFDWHLLSQLGKGVERRGGAHIPMLSDLKDSGSLEANFGQIIFPYRPEYYKIFEDEEGNSLRGVTRLITAKNRYIGKVEDVDVKLVDGKFYDLKDEIPPSSERSDYNPNITAPSKTNDDDDIPF